MAEIQYGAWADWVESTGSSWHDAGTTARARMADAGYDVSEGDSWMVNEASSAVRRGTGHARANLRELLRGLWEGDGTQLVRGSVLVIGVGQQTRDVSLYQTNLQSWLSDSVFWTDIATYVSDWSQEVFGDVRNWAVPDVSTPVRRDYLNDYLQHEFVLASAGVPTTATAGSYLQTGFSPLANAAWEHESGYGWTMVPMEQMAGWVSAQVDALRAFSVTTGQVQDHWGFAWAPRNLTGANASDFANKTGYILDRIASAVRDSGQTDGPDPGSAACGPPDQNLWCVGDLEGAQLNEAWKSFRVWTQSALTFTTPPQTIRAGTPSAAMTLSLVTSSGAQRDGDDTTHRDARLELAAGHVLDEPDRPMVDDLVAHDRRRLGHDQRLLLPRHDRRHPGADRVRGRRDERHADGDGHTRAGRIADGRAGLLDRSRSIEPEVRGRGHGHLRKRVSGDRGVGPLTTSRRLACTDERNRRRRSLPPARSATRPLRPSSTPLPARSRPRSRCE